MFGVAAALMMSGACPPPAPSVWYVWMVLPPMALMVSSTHPPSFRVSVWMATCTSYSSATFRQWSMTAGVAPQSSWILRPIAPALTCSIRGFSSEQFPFPRKPKFIGYSSAALSIISMFHGPGVQVVAFVPSAGPVPPPIMVVTPEYSAQSICCGQMKWICVSIPPAVTIIPSPARASVEAPTVMPGVTPSITLGFPALPIPLILPSLIPISALMIPVLSTIRAFVITRSRSPSALVVLTDCPIPSRIVLPPPNLISSP